MNYDNKIILIPAYQPDEKLVVLCNDLMESGFSHIVVVDDGSREECREFFEKCRKMGCTVLVHEKNAGKGQALKTGFCWIRENGLGKGGTITADSDGQHLIKDIVNVAEKMEENPGALVMGTRDFSLEQVPARSRFGNRFSSVMFRLSTGKQCPDTQTGLRGIPLSLLELACTEEGSRYEYEMNFLSDAVSSASLVEVPIEVIYEDNNSGSHFRPVRDSLRVFGRFITFVSISLSCSLVDYVAFLLIKWAIDFSPAAGFALSVFASTAIARVISNILNFILNRQVCFRTNSSLRRPIRSQVWRYIVITVGLMAASATGVWALGLVHFPAAAAKPIIDTLLFFASYWLQKNWVFKKRI